MFLWNHMWFHVWRRMKLHEWLCGGTSTCQPVDVSPFLGWQLQSGLGVVVIQSEVVHNYRDWTNISTHEQLVIPKHEQLSPPPPKKIFIQHQKTKELTKFEKKTKLTAVIYWKWFCNILFFS